MYVYVYDISLSLDSVGHYFTLVIISCAVQKVFSLMYTYTCFTVLCYRSPICFGYDSVRKLYTVLNLERHTKADYVFIHQMS